MHAASAYLAARLLAALLALLAVSAIIFAAVELLPGDPAAQLLGTYATPERLEAVRGQLGLDDPAPLRYARWLGGVLQGDLGSSIRTDQRVADLIARPALNTAVLAAAAFAAISAAALILAALGGAFGGRLIRAAVADAARLPHVEAARLAGLPERRVLLRHLLPSAVPATAQIFAFTAPFPIGGAVVVERIFAFLNTPSLPGKF